MSDAEMRDIYYNALMSTDKAEVIRAAEIINDYCNEMLAQKRHWIYLKICFDFRDKLIARYQILSW